jgi:DNA polymerase-3 subunit gamma/tau
LPDPADLARKLESGVAIATPGPSAPVASTLPATFEALIQLVEKAGKYLIAQRLRDEVGLVRYAPPEFAIRPSRPFDTRELGQVLKEATGVIWQIATEDAPAQPTIREQELAAEAAAREAMLAQPVVRAAFEHFPEAELIGWSEQRSATQ